MHDERIAADGTYSSLFNGKQWTTVPQRGEIRPLSTGPHAVTYLSLHSRRMQLTRLQSGWMAELRNLHLSCMYFVCTSNRSCIYL